MFDELPLGSLDCLTDLDSGYQWLHRQSRAAIYSSESQPHQPRLAFADQGRS